jgi:SAM-dependent methyltransferase
LRRSLASLRRRLARGLQAGAGSYDPESYWESRAEELIRIYDHPEEWEARQWTRGGVEEDLAPGLLRRRDARSVFVVGAGSGRQYKYLLPVVESVRGIDVSRRLVAECQRRYPEVTTHHDTVVGAHERHAAADAVVASAVLQHVKPSEITAAVTSVKSLAREVVILRELTLMDQASSYQWAHPYRQMFADWLLMFETVTDERPGVRVELLAFARTG